ncbi:chaperone protein DnaJ [Bombus vancouverensis nearcticus]|uniref:dnaJ homolog subfamily C member 24-like n=1 Tax=Bombus vancouverensis nearcticus TaxID=2705178 RepID=UPI0014388973|nr:dnaJ homolog subfamily C member 24-like [Bombus vancouverensis nearcticus]XP_033183381.1 dnaJ homolog subfamily C member 24-like [Bombus vancouverensis nearcticus]XP_033183382.1 dnaJ homolog subfamily C member 24-like [Bombus vancouverensis nearcticus]XP_033183383.1 dnaJ homolog subfamily C member 24-like [Bombus vancouverensis nearcticus]XP_033183384.1 dnaJ homolog subfamily C member 24-like [Bombus vancouverensis nearcticus]XP_050475516.1 dnaJ homolog subfamily C member 24-like [Bombus hu
MMDLMNYYDILGCTKESTFEDIKCAYRALALKFHPDKNATEFDSIKFQYVLKAWHVLRDPKLKEEYDAILKQEELDLENILIYAKIWVNELEEMDNNKDMLSYQCRCGGLYCIEKQHIQKKNQMIHVPCSECTLFTIIET